MIHWKILAIYMWDTTVSHLLGEYLPLTILYEQSTLLLHNVIQLYGAGWHALGMERTILSGSNISEKMRTTGD